MRQVRCQDNSEGIKVAKEGNLGVAYFGGQTHVFLSKHMYEERIGRENFKRVAIEIFGRDALTAISYRPDILVRPGYFSEEQVFQIELPSLVVYPNDQRKKVKIDPEKKIAGLVKIINKTIAVNRKKNARTRI
ncbi:MAG: hypothetical protein AABW80_03210 [Nanoarchaeota archaeon]